jgi:hypothetical protein
VLQPSKPNVRSPTGLVLIVAMAAFIGLGAACGTKAIAAMTTTTHLPASGLTPPVGGVPLCNDQDQVSQLSVTRTNPFPTNNIVFIFPDHVTSDNAPGVRAVAQAVCQLPVFAPGLLNCPLDLAIGYTLTFSDTEHDIVDTIVAMPGGCPSVTGLGVTRYATPTFWNLLASALSLPAPREYCDPFRGGLPTAPIRCGPPLQ